MGELESKESWERCRRDLGELESLASWEKWRTMREVGDVVELERDGESCKAGELGETESWRPFVPLSTLCGWWNNDSRGFLSRMDSQ